MALGQLTSECNAPQDSPHASKTMMTSMSTNVIHPPSTPSPAKRLLVPAAWWPTEPLKYTACCCVFRWLLGARGVGGGC